MLILCRCSGKVAHALLYGFEIRNDLMPRSRLDQFTVDKIPNVYYMEFPMKAVDAVQCVIIVIDCPTSTNKDNIIIQYSLHKASRKRAKQIYEESCHHFVCMREGAVSHSLSCIL